MNEKLAAMKTPDRIRAGVISSFILAICYLYITGLSSLPRVWAFMILLAVCLVLMLKSVIDLMVWAFGLVARFCGYGLGHTVRLLRHVR